MRNEAIVSGLCAHRVGSTPAEDQAVKDAQIHSQQADQTVENAASRRRSWIAIGVAGLGVVLWTVYYGLVAYKQGER